MSFRIDSEIELIEARVEIAKLKSELQSRDEALKELHKRFALAVDSLNMLRQMQRDLN